MQQLLSRGARSRSHWLHHGSQDESCLDYRTSLAYLSERFDQVFRKRHPDQLLLLAGGQVQFDLESTVPSGPVDLDTCDFLDLAPIEAHRAHSPQAVDYLPLDSS